MIAPLLVAAGRVRWRPVQVPALLLDAAAVAGAESASQAAAERLARRFGLTHLVS